MCYVAILIIIIPYKCLFVSNEARCKKFNLMGYTMPSANKPKGKVFKSLRKVSKRMVCVRPATLLSSQALLAYPSSQGYQNANNALGTSVSRYQLGRSVAYQ